MLTADRGLAQARPRLCSTAAAPLDTWVSRALAPPSLPARGSSPPHGLRRAPSRRVHQQLDEDQSS